jgi:hypothetical protein
MARVSSKKGNLPSSGALSMWKTVGGAILDATIREGGGRSRDDKSAKVQVPFKRLLDVFAKTKNLTAAAYGNMAQTIGIGHDHGPNIRQQRQEKENYSVCVNKGGKGMVIMSSSMKGD